MRGWERRIGDVIAGLTVAALLIGSVLWGEYDRKMDPSEAAPRMALEETEGEEKEEGPVLTEEQEQMLGEIYHALQGEDLESAAAVLEKEQDELAALFYETLEGERYLYDGRDLKKELEGEGMVLTLPGTVFYGEFLNGRPEGECMALRVVSQEKSRYDHSEGSWKNGRMEGEGMTGYRYYGNAPDAEAVALYRFGTFKENSMDGEILCESITSQGISTTWKIRVDNGCVKLDERWTYLEDTGEYQLMSEEQEGHAYVVNEDQADQPMWKNLLTWEE